MLLILITTGEKAQKPPHSWIVSIDGQHSKALQKPKAMRYAFLPKCTGRNKTSPTIASPTSWDCRAEAAATAPQRAHESQCGRGQTAIPAASKTTKNRLTHGKKANAQGGLKLNDGLPGRVGLGEMLLFGTGLYFFQSHTSAAVIWSESIQILP